MVSKHQLRCWEKGRRRESGRSPKSRSALFPESSQMISPTTGLSSHLPTSGKYGYLTAPAFLDLLPHLAGLAHLKYSTDIQALSSKKPPLGVEEVPERRSQNHTEGRSEGLLTLKRLTWMWNHTDVPHP